MYSNRTVTQPNGAFTFINYSNITLICTYVATYAVPVKHILAKRQHSTYVREATKH